MLEYFKKNWLGFVSLLIGIAGILLSFYFYSASLKVREPAFVVTKNVPLFSSPQGLSSEYLKLITKKDGQELLKNLYIQELAFWNNGQESVKKENVLTPISIVFDENIEIVDAFISESNRPSIVKPEIVFSPGGHVVGVDFVILEKNDGIKIQVVYASEVENIASVTGVIEGVSVIKNIDNLSKENIISSFAKIVLSVITVIAVLIVFSLVLRFLERVLGKVFGAYSVKIFTIVNRFFGGFFWLFIVVALLFFFYDTTLKVSESSVINSIPKMEKVGVKNDF